MGSTASKPSERTRDNRKVQKYDYHSDEESLYNNITEKMNYLGIDNDLKKYEAAPVALSHVKAWEQDLLSDRKNLLTINALTHNAIPEVIKSTPNITKDTVEVWNVQIPLEGSPVTNQKSSGRCWMFASTSCFRVAYMKKFNLEKFELSQNYLFFYDKLEKANYLLTNIIETADLDLDSRVVQAILGNGLSDGGQWDMIVNLVSKYGLVPKTIYQDSYHATNSSPMNYVLVNKLKEYALVLRKLVEKGSSKEQVLKVKKAQIQEIYNILALTLGPPPKPDEDFTWDYKDKSGAVYSKTLTPKAFSELVDLGIHTSFSLINDPRNEYYKLYTVDRLNNVVGGKPIDYVNVPIEDITDAVVTALKAGYPVFFGSDVGKFSERGSGILDTNAFDYELAFNTKLNLTKAERLEVGSSAMTHAMVITAVHIVDGEVQRYRIENSWGEDAGNKGYFVASQDWFKEYVYQVVTYVKLAPKELTKIWRKGDYTVLPIYDPMGALA
ncbi:CYFA0S09e03532g1_1 [Cyberlindnera fabianii]|uniref:Cysteine proteinase 1, mitochondrial n=1 Tax=Cyberlindnera fabianii TaxID=36022 RepID=A0A061B5Y5_CYBFA|nr:CYFA0S09e03532g1_1 [Cyberlindnera fabianii]